MVNRDLVELIVKNVTANHAVLERFLKEPGAVIAELTRVDQATLDAIGQRLRERFSGSPAGEISDRDLQKVAGGLISLIGSWKPIIGRSFSFGSTITQT
jgi:hypothetical protein